MLFRSGQGLCLAPSLLQRQRVQLHAVHVAAALHQVVRLVHQHHRGFPQPLQALQRIRLLTDRLRGLDGARDPDEALAQGRRAIPEADQAQTMDEQTANQAYIVATMNFVPGFEAYGTARLPDAAGYRPYEIYRGQTTVDNRRLMRGLTGASDQRHADMVNSQYER